MSFEGGGEEVQFSLFSCKTSRINGYRLRNLFSHECARMRETIGRMTTFLENRDSKCALVTKIFLSFLFRFSDSSFSFERSFFLFVVVVSCLFGFVFCSSLAL